MEHQAGPTLRVYVREGTAGPARARQDAALERARRLVQTGIAADIDVETWDAKVPVDPDDVDDTAALETFDTFSEWARTEDVRLYPAFQTRECYSWEDGARYTALVFPVMSLAVIEVGDVTAVYPHVDAEERYNVFDGLAILAATHHEPATGTDPEVPAE